MSKPVRGRCFPWDLNEFLKRHYVAVVDDTRADPDDIPVLILPVEGDKVGEFEPWMVEYVRDPHPKYIPEHLAKTQLAASHAIATALAQLWEVEDE